MNRQKKIAVAAAFAAVAVAVAAVVLLWPWGSNKSPAPAAPAAEPAPAGAPTAESVAPVDPTLQACLDRCKVAREEQTAKSASTATKGAKPRRRGAATATSAPAVPAAPAPATTPRIAGSVEVDVSSGRICVRGEEAKDFAQVVFFGSYGHCPEELRYAELNDGCAEVPKNLHTSCRWFNFLTSDGAWASVAPGYVARGARVVQERSGPFRGAHAYALPE